MNFHPKNKQFRSLLILNGQNHNGFSLIEVLIAVIILSFGILGLSAIQIVSLKNNEGSALRSQASLFAYEIMDRMRANRNAAVNGTYDQAITGFSNIPIPPANASIAQIDRYDWYRKLEAELPGARGAINCAADAVCTITVEWNDARAEGSTAAVPKQLIVAGQL